MPSTTIDQAIKVYVLGSSAVSSAIDSRLFYVEAERDAAMPYATYFLVSDPHEPVSFDHSSAGQARVQFNTYDDNRVNALTISDTIRDRIHLYGGSMDGVTVVSVKCSGTVTEKMPEENAFRSRFDALVTYYDA